MTTGNHRGHGHRGLSRGAEQLEVLLAEQQQRGDTFDCDVLIVGSGYGGAVAAARLAGALEHDDNDRPARVWLVERGIEHLPGRFPSRLSELPGHVRFAAQDGQPPRGRDEGLFDLRLGRDVSVLLASGLGGGSLINAGVMAEPEPAVFETPPWPGGLGHEALQPAFELARAMLGPLQKIPAERSARKLVVFDTLVQAMGGAEAERCGLTMHFGDEPQVGPGGIDLHSCTMCGDCLTGCNQGAKGSLDTSYLAHAAVHRVPMFCGVAVERIEPGDDAAPWRVRWHYTDRQIRRTLPDGGTIRARRVVLAAGSLGSTEILLRSQAALALPAGRLGKRFSTNGDALMAGVGHAVRVNIVGDPESDPADASARLVGPTICGMVKVPPTAGRPAFVLEEFAVPAALHAVLGEVTTTRALFGREERDPLLPLAADPHAVHADAVQRTSLFGVMGDDGAHGTLELPVAPAGGEAAVEGGVRVRWPMPLRPQPLYDAASAWLADAAKTTVLASGELLAGMAPMLTVHPLGGCAMAERGSEGVVNTLGQVFSGDGAEVHETLVVLDGAIVPGALGVNPALTITALAEHALPALRERWHLVDAPPRREPAPPLPARAAMRRTELPPAEVMWGLRERLHGACECGGQPHWARLELEFEPVPGFGRALQLTHRVVKVRRAELFLAPVAAGTDEFSVPDEAFAPGAVAAAQLDGTVELFAPERWPNDLDDAAATDWAPARIVYRLAVQGLGTDAPAPWRLGARLVGVKTLRRLRGPPPWRSPWRELSEMEMSLEGRPVGRWALDLADLAQRREPLLALRALTTMPDALADLGAVAAWGLRRLAPRLLGANVADAAAGTDLAQFAQRWPGPLEPGGRAPRVFEGPGWPASWRLSRYEDNRAGASRPVVLIHGLGASGANFTHPAVPGNLARLLQAAGRDVWVLDVRSSIANEDWRALPGSAAATVEQVALADIPPAIDFVRGKTGGAKVDVLAHCMGAVMFTLAVLGDKAVTTPAGATVRPALHRMIRAVVLSQVGPLVRLSPLNQFRGLVGSYLREFLDVEELDATPDVRRGADGAPERVERGITGRLLDALLATFPYADDDGGDGIAAQPPLAGTAFKDIRHRADAIFGQLFEPKNMEPQALAHLAALFGWVKLPMLAQAIHFARHEMLTDARGRNAFLSRDRLKSRLDFPVLMLHGQRNRVFDWRASLLSLRLLRAVRGETGPIAVDTVALGAHGEHGERRHYARDRCAQLVVLSGYGHLDSLLGARVATEVFPVIDEFFDDAERLGQAPPAGPGTPQPADTSGAPPPRQPEAPWFGPMLGAVRYESAGAGGGEGGGEGGTQADGEGGADGPPHLVAYVLVHPTLRRPATHGFVVVPMRRTAGGPMPNLERAAWLRWPNRGARLPRQPDGTGTGAREAAVRLAFDPAHLHALGDTFALLTLHQDMPLPPSDAPVQPVDWLQGGLRLFGDVAEAVKHWVQRAHRRGELSRVLFSLPDKVRRAAGEAAARPQPPALTFALASCQYPPGLLDAGPAQASLRRLADDADAADGPQFLLLAGDQVYADATAGVFDPVTMAMAGETHRAARFDRVYEQTWGLPAFRRLGARLPVYPMLDDHEVLDRWQGAAEPGDAEAQAERAAAMHAFDRFQEVLVPRDTFIGAGVAASKSYALHPGGVPLVVLDTRTRRSWRRAGNVAEAAILPGDELDAVIAWLGAAPRDAVKLVLTPVPLLPPECLAEMPLPERLRSDGWTGFPASVSRLLGALCEHRIGRVVLLAGDSHLSSVTSFEFAGRPQQRIVAVVASGLYTPWPFANARADDFLFEADEVALGLPGQAVSGRLRRHAVMTTGGYAVVRLEPHAGNVKVHVSLRGGDGSTVECTVDTDAAPPPGAAHARPAEETPHA